MIRLLSAPALALSVLTLVLSAVAVPASAQVATGPLPPAAEAELRLERTFQHFENWGEIGRYIMGVSGTVLGPVGIGAGLYFMLDEGSINEEDRRLLTGGILIGAGAVTLAGGIVKLLTPSLGSERLADFRRAQEGGLSERELGMFEGQLRLDAQRGQRGRNWQMWAGIAQIVGGGAIAISTAAADTPQGEEETGFILGGVVGGLGVLTLVKSLLFESHGERAWRAYLEEEAAPAEGSVDVVPSAGPGVARIDLVGQF